MDVSQTRRTSTTIDGSNAPLTRIVKPALGHIRKSFVTPKSSVPIATSANRERAESLSRIADAREGSTTRELPLNPPGKWS
jgi:hypothetical protein